MKTKPIKWVNAQKHHPKEGQSVLTLHPIREKGNYCCMTCQYLDGMYVSNMHYDSTNANGIVSVVIDRRFVLENVRAWADLNSVTRRADAILDAMPSPWPDDEKE